jgi:hypothetical protein
VKLGTRSRIAIAAAVLSGGALLAPASSSATSIPQCVPDHCDSLIRYFSDATYTHLVGEQAGEVCGVVDWGEQTQYIKHIWRTC